MVIYMTKSKISFMCLIILLVSSSILMTSCSLSKKGLSPNQTQKSISQNTQNSDLDSIDKDNQSKLICLFSLRTTLVS